MINRYFQASGTPTQRIDQGGVYLHFQTVFIFRFF